ncbi:MAG: 4-(cytidine 5'-diphospho)-2-C-methyl-D-erythritol kinase [Paludibacteraceae bacterium]
MIIYPNAKINIGLNVVKRREDGYHDIETIFYPIGLHDILRITPFVTDSGYRFSTSGINIGGKAENNLVIKSLKLLQKEYAIPSVDISLTKQIPSGAGLGGGSADGAFTLKAINELFTLQLSPERLEQLAATIGADCPFFIKNRPTYATGIGNVFSPINILLKNYWLLLVKPDIYVSTAAAYSDIIPTPSDKLLPDLIQLPVNQWKYYIKNDFEKSVFTKQPKIGIIKDKLYDLGAVYASMSGSGAAVYGIFLEKPEYEKQFEKFFTYCDKMK